MSDDTYNPLSFLSAPSDAWAGNYAPVPYTRGTLTEDDAYRQNYARDREVMDALNLGWFGPRGGSNLARLAVDYAPSRLAGNNKTEREGIFKNETGVMSETSHSPFRNALSSLFGTPAKREERRNRPAQQLFTDPATGERYQTWPEKVARSASTLAGDVAGSRSRDLLGSSGLAGLAGIASGGALSPGVIARLTQRLQNGNYAPPEMGGLGTLGLRREDLTDIPPDQSGPVEGGIPGLGTAFNAMGITSRGGDQPGDELMERAQDLAGIMGGGPLTQPANRATLASGAQRPPGGPMPSRRSLFTLNKTPEVPVAEPRAPLDVGQNAPAPQLPAVRDPLANLLQGPGEAPASNNLLKQLTEPPAAAEPQGINKALQAAANVPLDRRELLRGAGAVATNASRLGRAAEALSQPKQTAIAAKEALPKFEEVWKREGDFDVGSLTEHVLEQEFDSFVEEHDRNPTEKEYKAIVKNISEDVASRPHEYVDDFGDGVRDYGGPHYYDYQLPDGENYRELLVKQPDKTKSVETSAEIIPDHGGFVVVDAQGVRRGWYNNQSLAKEAIQRIKQQTHQVLDESNQFHSSSWDEPNVLGHLRMHDRNIPGVGKSLHLEELNSEWHQEGSKRGYGKPDLSKWSVRQSKSPNSVGGREILNERGEQVGPSSFHPKMTDRELIESYSKGLDGRGVPDAPLKTTWPDYLLRRAIREAVEQGHDAVSWTPGEHQLERHGLHVDKPTHRVGKRMEDGRYPAYKTYNNQESSIGLFSTKEKAEAAARAADSEAIYDPRAKEVSDFYDKHLVDRANVIGKEYGTKVEKRKLDSSLPWDAEKYKSLQNEAVKTKNASDFEALRNYGQQKDMGVQGPVLRITPQLRKAVKDGTFSLLSDSGKPGAPIAALEKGAAKRYLVPAYKYKDGKIWKGEIGDDHENIFGEDISRDPDFTRGFVNHKGQFLTGDRAAQYALKEGLVHPSVEELVRKHPGMLTADFLMSDSGKPGAPLAALEKAPVQRTRAQIDKEIDAVHPKLIEHGRANPEFDAFRDPWPEPIRSRYQDLMLERHAAQNREEAMQPRPDEDPTEAALRSIREALAAHPDAPTQRPGQVRAPSVAESRAMAKELINATGERWENFTPAQQQEWLRRGYDQIVRNRERNAAYEWTQPPTANTTTPAQRYSVDPPVAGRHRVIEHRPGGNYMVDHFGTRDAAEQDADARNVQYRYDNRIRDSYDDVHGKGAWDSLSDINREHLRDTERNGEYSDRIRAVTANTTTPASRGGTVEPRNGPLGGLPGARAAFDEHIGKYIPEEEFRDKFFGGMHSPNIRMDVTSRGVLKFDGELQQGGQRVGQMVRELNMRNGVAHHDYLSLDYGKQGSGIAKNLLANQVELYHRLGMNSVETYADIDVGSYAWAKYGFEPVDEAAWSRVADKAKRRLQQHEASWDIDPRDAAVVKKILDAKDPRAIWDLVDSQFKLRGGDSVAKNLLFDNGWDAHLDLYDQDNMSRFHSYVKGNKKK